MTGFYFCEGERIRILGLPFRIHRIHRDRDVITVYSWRDVIARPITLTAATALGEWDNEEDAA